VERLEGQAVECVTSVPSATDEKNPNRFNGRTVTHDVTDAVDDPNASVTAAIVTLGENPYVTNSATRAAPNKNKISDVTDVTLVTHVAGGGGGEICAQCGAGPSTDPPSDAPTVQVKNGAGSVWLHAGRCRQFWIEEHSQFKTGEMK
jgi:hypothetical protein